MITNNDLKMMLDVAYDTRQVMNWQGTENKNAVVCKNHAVIIAINMQELALLISEILDHRAKDNYVPGPTDHFNQPIDAFLKDWYARRKPASWELRDA